MSLVSVSADASYAAIASAQSLFPLDDVSDGDGAGVLDVAQACCCALRSVVFWVTSASTACCAASIAGCATSTLCCAVMSACCASSTCLISSLMLVDGTVRYVTYAAVTMSEAPLLAAPLLEALLEALLEVLLVPLLEEPVCPVSSAWSCCLALARVEFAESTSA